MMGRFRGVGAPGRLELEVGKGGWGRGIEGDDFSRVGQPEDQAHLRLAIVEGLEVEAGISSLPPEICHLGEKVVGETLGCGGPLCWCHPPHWGPRHQELWP